MLDPAETQKPSSGAFTQRQSNDLRERSDEAVTVAEQRQVARDAIDVVDDLRDAMKWRSSIDVAKGLIMAAMGCDESVAFDHLVSLSQRRHVKLHTLAVEVIASHQSLSEANGSGEVWEEGMTG